MEVSPWKKAVGAAIWQSGHQKISNFSARKAPGNQHEIRIAFFERDKSSFFSNLAYTFAQWQLNVHPLHAVRLQVF